MQKHTPPDGQVFQAFTFVLKPTGESTRKLARLIEQGRGEALAITVTRRVSRLYVKVRACVERPQTNTKPRTAAPRVGVDIGRSNVSSLPMDSPFQDTVVDPVLCSPYDPPDRCSARNTGDVAVERVGLAR